MTRREVLPAVVTRAGGAFCGDCFKEFPVPSFRATFGEKQQSSPGERVLPAWSARLRPAPGPPSSSRASVQLWGPGRSTTGPRGDFAKTLHFVTRAVYVREGAAQGQSPESPAQTPVGGRLSCRLPAAPARRGTASWRRLPADRSAGPGLSEPPPQPPAYLECTFRPAFL